MSNHLTYWYTKFGYKIIILKTVIKKNANLPIFSFLKLLLLLDFEPLNVCKYC